MGVGGWRGGVAGSFCSLLLVLVSVLVSLPLDVPLLIGGSGEPARIWVSPSTRPNGSGIGIGFIDLTALVILVEKVPFMLVIVKWEVNPVQSSDGSEGMTFRKL